MSSIVSILAVTGPARASHFATLFQVLDNIVKAPENLKFRRLRLSNNTVQRRVLKVAPVLDFLLHVGFEVTDEHLVFFPHYVLGSDDAGHSAATVVHAAAVGGQSSASAPDDAPNVPSASRSNAATAPATARSAAACTTVATSRSQRLRWPFLDTVEHALGLLREAKKVAAAYANETDDGFPDGQWPSSPSSPLSSPAIAHLAAWARDDSHAAHAAAASGSRRRGRGLASAFLDAGEYEDGEDSEDGDESEDELGALIASELLAAGQLRRRQPRHDSHQQRQQQQRHHYNTPLDEDDSVGDTDFGDGDFGDSAVRRLLQQRHAVASAFTALQARKRVALAADYASGQHREAVHVHDGVVNVGSQDEEEAAGDIVGAAQLTAKPNRGYPSAPAAAAAKVAAAAALNPGPGATEGDADWDKCDLCVLLLLLVVVAVVMMMATMTMAECCMSWWCRAAEFWLNQLPKCGVCDHCSMPMLVRAGSCWSWCRCWCC
jgi:hypothetical protein